MRLLHISETTLDKFQMSTDIPMSKTHKNIKRCEFCVKIWYRECRDIAKKLWSWLSIFYQFFETKIFYPRIFDITKSFSAW